RNVPNPYLFFSPQKNACTEPIRLHQALHELDLVDAGSEKEIGKPGQSFLTEIASPVKIIAPGSIAGGEQCLVSVNIARQSPRDGPHGTRIERLQQHRVRHQSRNATV